MARSEQDLRTEAVRRRLAGESPEAIAGSLGRSVRWVQKWVGRYQAGDEGWAAGGKRGPKRPANRTPAELERQVLAVRERLVPHARVVLQLAPLQISESQLRVRYYVLGLGCTARPPTLP
jgi:transposase